MTKLIPLIIKPVNLSRWAGERLRARSDKDELRHQPDPSKVDSPLQNRCEPLETCSTLIRGLLNPQLLQQRIGPSEACLPKTRTSRLVVWVMRSHLNFQKKREEIFADIVRSLCSGSGSGGISEASDRLSDAHMLELHAHEYRSSSNSLPRALLVTVFVALTTLDLLTKTRLFSLGPFATAFSGSNGWAASITADGAGAGG